MPRAAMTMTNSRCMSPPLRRAFKGFEPRAQLLELGVDRTASDFRARRMRRRVRRLRAQEGAVAPPVDAHLAGFLSRGNQQSDADRQQLDFDQPDADVAGDDHA